MRVLHINSVSYIKSTGRICSEIADYLNENGLEGYIAYSTGIPYEKCYKIGNLAEKKLHALFSRIFGLQAYFSKSGTRRLLNYIENLKPDVVHLHNLHSNYINFKILIEYLAENDIPTTITLHDCWFYTGKCTYYTITNCYRWRNGCGDCPRLKNDNPSWFFDRTRKMYNDKKNELMRIRRLAVIGVSEWITNEARNSFLSSAKIMQRIYNWVDLDVFRPVDTIELRRKMNLNNKFIILGVASEWCDAKGLNKFVELAGCIQDDTVIILVGGMKPGINLPGNVIKITETHNANELVQYYSMADVFLNFSLEETFGKVSAEALACGTPVISNNSTANSEIVGEGCGYVLDNINIDNVMNALFIVRNKGKRYYSENCISFVRANFVKNERIHDHINVYQELLKED